MARPKIGQVLIAQGVLRAGQEDLILAEQQSRPKLRFGEVAMALGLAKEAHIAAALAAQFDLKLVPEERLAALTATADALACLPPQMMRARQILPTFYDRAQKVLTLVVSDPTDIAALKEAQAASGAERLRLFVASASGLADLLRRLLPPEPEEAPPPPPRPAVAPVNVVYEPNTARREALAALLYAEGDPSLLASTPDEVMALLEQGRCALLLHHRSLTPEVSVELSRWRKVAPELRIRVLDGFGPGHQEPVSAAAARDFLLGLLEFALLAGETRQIALRGRIRRTLSLARELAQELNLPAAERDAVAVGALFYHASKLGVLSGLSDESNPAMGAALSRHALSIALLEQFHPPWAVLELLRALEARGVKPGPSRSAELVYSAARVAELSGLEQLGDEAKEHDPEVLQGLERVLAREQLRDRLAQEGRAKRPTVLLAERDGALVTALEARLGQEGYEVVPVTSGEEALTYIKAHKPAALLANLRLPGRDGLSLLVEMKRDPALAEIPVFLFTDHRGPRDLARGLELGAEDVMEKPVNLVALMARLRRVVARAPTSSGGVHGKLSDLPLADLLQTLYLGGRSAEVVVSGGREQGVIHLDGGKVVYAAQGAKSGEEAAFAMIGQRVGQFEVLFGRPVPGVNVTGGTEYLLLEGLRRMDEGGR